MHLLIRRSQRDDGWFESSITFIRDCQLDMSEEEHYLFTRYGIADRIVYNSEDFVEHLEAADAAREEAAKDVTDLGTVYSQSLVAFFHNIMGRLSLQISLQSLVDGLHVESQDLEETLYIEKLVREGVEFIAQYFELGFTFDSSEALHEY
jgi:hypothetical protein